MGVSRATIPRIRSIRLVPSLFTWRAGTVIVPNGEGGVVRCENRKKRYFPPGLSHLGRKVSIRYLRQHPLRCTSSSSYPAARVHA